MTDQKDITLTNRMEEKVQAFNAGVEEIEKKYQDFFLAQVPGSNSLTQDHLKNYFTLDYNSTRGRITFHSAHLPVSIRVEVEVLFHKIWPSSGSTDEGPEPLTYIGILGA